MNTWPPGTTAAAVGALPLKLSMPKAIALPLASIPAPEAKRVVIGKLPGSGCNMGCGSAAKLRPTAVRKCSSKVVGPCTWSLEQLAGHQDEPHTIHFHETTTTTHPNKQRSVVRHLHLPQAPPLLRGSTESGPLFLAAPRLAASCAILVRSRERGSQTGSARRDGRRSPATQGVSSRGRGAPAHAE